MITTNLTYLRNYNVFDARLPKGKGMSNACLVPLNSGLVIGPLFLPNLWFSLFFTFHLSADIDYSLSVSTEFGTLYMILNKRWLKSLESVATIPFLRTEVKHFYIKNAYVIVFIRYYDKQKYDKRCSTNVWSFFLSWQKWSKKENGLAMFVNL